MKLPRLSSGYGDIESADKSRCVINGKFQNKHIFERGIDLLLDPRLPHALPYTLWRLARYNLPANLPSPVETLHVCLTFDIEHDYHNPESAGSAQRFLERYVQWADSRGWRSTLYVQGSLVPELAELIRNAAQSHQIGLHGLYHEVWGRSRWWQYSQRLVGLSRTEKRERLQLALETFDMAGVERPRTFRAPYLNADRETLALLAQHGFTSDSSPAAYLGALPVPRQIDGIWQLPVTANPHPRRDGVTFRYPELSLGNMLRMGSKDILATTSMAVHLQQEAGLCLPPHLVILAHPWEFEATSGVGHASADNWGRLEQILMGIAESYPVKFIPITELITRNRMGPANENIGSIRTLTN